MTAPSAEKQLRAFEIAIVGNDLLLEALPGRPLQVAHAVHACGYDLVVPVSWGEELVAMHVLDGLESAGRRPLIFCACPKVRSRLMASGPELLPHLVSCIAPPAAAARYLRALEPDVRMRVTYIGGCPGAVDTSIDVRIAPSDFLSHLEKRSISILEQPLVYESVIPPDRRRHVSLPGGMPAADAVGEHGFHFTVLREGDDLSAEIAEHIIAADRVIMDMAPSVGCACAGFISGGSREAVIALEPPHSALPVIDRDVHVAIDVPPVVIPKPEESPPPPVVDDPRGPAHEQDAPAPVAGVHSIEAAARRRAERLRIAVTPPGVRAPQTARAAEIAQSAAEAALGEGREAPAEPPATAAQATPPGAVSHEPPTALPAEPPEITVTAEASPEPMPREELIDDSGEAESTAPVPTQVVPPDAPVVVRRRTPVFGVWHASRTTARQRVVSKEGAAVPRAYNAVRHRSGSFVAIVSTLTPSEAVQPAPEIVRPVAADPAALEPAVHPKPVPVDVGPEPRRSRRRDPRRVDAPGASRKRRLWDLLMAILMIAAVIVTLFLITRG